MSFNLALILGGARSGKSAHAEQLAKQLAEDKGLNLTYIATSQVYDTEMQERVDLHKRRRNAEWKTVEEPVLLLESLQREAKPDTVVLVDCLTLWLTNLILNEALDEQDQLDRFVENLSFKGPVILVSNEVGLGIVPENKLARRFRDLAGTLHQKIAAKADLVTLVAAGLPLNLKEN
ncbi:MAG: bifunctional adenosylcobinamide kinase/adenosylcobinamide-phosphate guanylyltransferase [Alphaproteobacteria bacterium]